MWPNLRKAIYRPLFKLAMERSGHGSALGFTVTRVGDGEAEITFPYNTAVIGNPLTGVVHGGVIVSLLDTCCGIACWSVMKQLGFAPTMDLRLDYMRPAEPDREIYVSAKVYRDTSSVIFCRGSAWQDDPDKPIAHCVANFMRIDNPKLSYAGIVKRQLRRIFTAPKTPEAGND